jgi:hypothetical protein
VRGYLLARQNNQYPRARRVPSRSREALTLVLLFGVDIKLAGSLSLAVSLLTMLIGFERYSRDRSFVVKWAQASRAMACG